MDNKELFGENLEQEPVYETETIPVSELVMPSEPEMTSEQIQQSVEAISKKGNNGAVVAVVTILFILVIGLCIYIAVSVSNMMPKDGEKQDTEYETQAEDPWKEILGDEYKDTETQENSDDTANDTEHDFSGPYYQEVTDCIDENVSYEIDKKSYDCEETYNNVWINTSYIQLEGDIPGLGEINRVLKEDVTFYAENYEKNKEDILETLKESGTGIEVTLESYVTYNTEDLISVVVRENISMGYMYRSVALRCYNINLDTGTILNNTSILNLEEGFGQEFRERSNKQNGISESGMEAYTNEEIERMLADETSLIIFYTPLGLELGYNYTAPEYTGWITITMQDYEEYLAK